MNSKLIENIKRTYSDFFKPRQTALIFTFLIAVFLLLFWWQVDNWLERRLRDNAYAGVSAQIHSYNAGLAQVISQRLSLISGLRSFIETEQGTETELLLQDAEAFVSGLYIEGIRNIAIAPDGIMQFVYPKEGNESVLGYDPSIDTRPNVRADVERAIETRQIILSLPVELIQGGVGIIARQAVFWGDSYWGLVNIVIDVPPLFVDAGLISDESGLEIAIQDQSGKIFFGSESVFDTNPATTSILLPEGNWILAGIPNGGWESAYQENLLFLRLIGTIAFSSMVLVAYLVFRRQDQLRLLVNQRTRELADTNESLQQELIEREKIESALRNSEKRYRDLFERVPIGLYNTTPEGELLAVNSALIDMLGYPDRETLQSIHAADLFVNPEDRKKQQQILETEGIFRGYEMQAYRYDGSIIWVRDSAQAVEITDGNTFFSPGSLENITERKLAEQALLESEAKFRNIVDASPMGMHMYQLEPDGRLIFSDSNPASDLILGVDNSQFVGKTIEEAFPALADSEIPDRYRAAALEGKSWKADQITYEENKISGAFEVYAFQTSPGRMVVLFLDITERKQAENALKDYSTRLEEMVEHRTKELQEAQSQLVEQEKLAVLGKLAGGMGHELRNPLGVISNAVYYLQLILPTAQEKVTGYLEIIQSETQQAANIVSDLLNFASNKSPDAKMCSIDEIVKKAVAVHSIPENVEVFTHIPDEAGVVFADPSQIEHALANLVVNAHQAMPDGGSLTINAKDDKDELILSLTDTGAGIPKENQDELFEPLYTTKPRGIGLGLAIAKKFIESNHGSIRVLSAEGKGTTVEVRLPISTGN